MDSVTADVITPVVDNRGSYITNSVSLHLALRPIIILAQCFGLFPVNGVNSSDASHLRFTWRSFKILYSCIATTAVTVLTVYSIHRLTTTKITSSKTSNVVFYVATGMTSILFIRLAKQWPRLAINWENMERELFMRHPRNNVRTTLTLRFKMISSIVMLLALRFRLT